MGQFRDVAKEVGRMETDRMKKLPPKPVKQATWIERAVTAEATARVQKQQLAKLRATLATAFYEQSEPDSGEQHYGK